MAVRPVFVAVPNDKIFVRKNIDFQYFPGFSLSQKRKCIDSLHQAYLTQNPNSKILEISSKSANELGVRLSAFNLRLQYTDGVTCSVESAYQAGKVFENGGPYTDLREKSSREAKKDSRLQDSGNIIGFQYGEHRFPLSPKTYFYDWLYITALVGQKDLAAAVLEYDAFTDIVFNPQRQVNCQAEAAAVYVSLCRQNLLEQAMADEKAFLRVVFGS